MNSKEGLYLIPEHMRGAVVDWIEKGRPHPDSMGSFFHALLCNDFRKAVATADVTNREYFLGWSQFLSNYMPGSAWGSREAVMGWHQQHHAPAPPSDAAIGIHKAVPRPKYIFAQYGQSTEMALEDIIKCVDPVHADELRDMAPEEEITIVQYNTPQIIVTRIQ